MHWKLGGKPREEIHAFFRKIIDDENAIKKILLNKSEAEIDPVKKIALQIQEIEGKT
jgi:hypothetical protein